jgi:hypothetical protein
MADATQLSRLSLRQQKVLEVPWPQMPSPPPELLKLPGARENHEQQKLYMERVQNVFNNLVNNMPKTFTIEVRTSDPANPVTGQIWLLVP